MIKTFVVTALVVFGLALAPEAHADPVYDYADIVAPAVCDTLDGFPNASGVMGTIEAIEEDSGFGPYDAGRVVGYSVANYCPRHLAMIQSFSKIYS